MEQDMQIIDVHTHVVPEKFPPYSGPGKDIPWPSMVPAHACHAHVVIQGKNYRTVHQSCWHVDDRLQDMERKSIGVQCLSPMPELLSYWLPAKDAQALLRYINDSIAAMVARQPQRFRGLGAVPLQDVDLAIRELEYVMNTLKFDGVELASHIDGTTLGDPRFEPFFAAAERMGAAIFVHALRPAGRDRLAGPVSEQVVCFPGEIGLAVASMITGGIAERHPKLRIAFSHGGGVAPILMGRLDRSWDTNAKLREVLPNKPSVYSKRFYYDSIVFKPASLKFILDAFGESQVFVGSDYPFVGAGDPDPVAFLRSCGLDARVLDRVLGENAARFLGVGTGGE
jgi:aminocarboxymuconate-semialdehyde decarboxylase